MSRRLASLTLKAYPCHHNETKELACLEPQQLNKHKKGTQIDVRYAGTRVNGQTGELTSH